MPLSEQEQRLLDEMERQLMHNDADVVHAGARQTLSYRNLLLGALLVLAGLGAVIGGIALWNTVLVAGIVLGVAGFAAMVGGVILALTPAKEQPADQAPRAGARPSAPSRAAGQSFTDRMNDRWDRRQRGE